MVCGPSSALPIRVRQILGAHSHAHSLTHCLWRLVHHNTAEWSPIKPQVSHRLVPHEGSLRPAADGETAAKSRPSD